MSDANGIPRGPAFVLSASDNSLSYLELEDNGEGGKTPVEVIKHFDPEESFLNLYMMYTLLGELKETRLARLKGENVASLVTLITMDREKLQSIRKSFIWRTII